MKFALVLICCILIPSTISELIENIDELWEKYKVKYSKSYSDPTEDAMRRKLFEENVHIIAYHNVEAALGMHSWEKGFSEFTDWVKYSKSYSDPTEDAMRRKLFEENVHIIAYHNVEAALGMHSWEKGFSEFTDWVKYSKSYSDPTEDAMRRKLFEENVHIIAYHNVEAALGMHSWEKGFSEFTDWIPNELTSRQGCLLVRDSKMSSLNGSKSNFPHQNLTTENLPKHVDWRKENILTPVKSQGGCGSCWAFAVTGALEAHLALSTGKRTSLSEQNLVDCDKKSHGCDGGSEMKALEYVMENGIDTEESYPYKGKDQKCQFSEDDVGGRCEDYVELQDSEDDILIAVAKEGPVIASLHGSSKDFMHYRNGIFSSDRCNGQVNHAVLIVGYGEKDGEEYWIIKNSWGEGWGMNGYMYLKRNAPFMCRIGKVGVYPIGVKI